jgi:hypothetical protein
MRNGGGRFDLHPKQQLPFRVQRPRFGQTQIAVTV